jgi:cytochrome c oxidase subunit IV
MTVQQHEQFARQIVGQASRPSHEDHEDFRHHVRRYLYVFYALIFGTLVTVGASYIPFGHHAVNIAVALFIACSKALLVAGFFMHLISERKLIYGLLLFTGIFFLGLMLLTVGAFADFPTSTVTH